MGAHADTVALAGFHDLEPATEDFRAAALAGLSRQPKEIPAKFFYDAEGSRLFEAICGLKEYYVTRTELGILARRAREIAGRLPERAVVIEFGSGSSRKIRHLLDALPRARAYVPVDISREHLIDHACTLADRYPAVDVVPVCADFVADFDLPPGVPAEARVVFFPGSTIGNFHPREAVRLLRLIAFQLGRGGWLLIGVDLKKDPAILHAAYNDADGVTAAFNLNLLTRMNRELAASFDVDRFAHRAVYNDGAGRIEMHLVSRVAQRVSVADAAVTFEQGETIHTENSYKYTVPEFQSLAAEAGFEAAAAWTDDEGLFSVQLFRAA